MSMEQRQNILSKEKALFLIEKTQQIKRKCLEMCVNAGTGHLTTAFSCAEIVTALYYEVMNYSGSAKQPGDDHFLMSKNHGSVITYPIFADLGWISEDELMSFMKNGSRLGGHGKRNIPGTEFSGGSLGIGLGVGAGLAYGLRMTGDTANTFVILGDGECYEGSVWEAAMFAGHQKLDNLVAIVDRNRLALTDFTEHMLSLESMKSKWSAFNWEVTEVDGHDIRQVVNALRWAVEYQGKPVCVLADTEKGHGIPSMCNNPFMHGVAPKGTAAKKAFDELEQEYGKLLGEEKARDEWR